MLKTACDIKINYYKSTDSTNLRAKESVINNVRNKEDFPLPQLFITDDQTAGRGRLGRSWTAPAGCNIAMSYLFKTTLSPEHIPGVTLLAALAVTDTIYEIMSSKSIRLDNPGIKWPNDIVLNGRKLCGILTELIAPDHIIVGIGINVNTPEFPDTLKDMATSLLLETRESWDRDEITSLITDKLTEYVYNYEQKESLEHIREKYNNLLVSYNKEVVIIDNSKDSERISRICRGIDSSGALLTEDTLGNIIPISSGEVSIRGIYGYI